MHGQSLRLGAFQDRFVSCRRLIAMMKQHARKAAPTAQTHPAGPLFQDLLVYQDESAAAANALAYAEAIAAVSEGHVAGLMFGFMSPYPATVYMEATPDIWLAAQRRAAEEADAVEKRLKARSAFSKAGAELRRKEVMGGEAGRVLAVHGRYADAIVIGWSKRGGKKDGSRDGSEFERDLFRAVLFESGRPVILVPETYKAKEPPRRILVAWSPEREATRAVHDALPVLRDADLVSILVVAEGKNLNGEEDAGTDIARHLARHNVNAEVKHVPANGRSAQAVIADEARYLGADLIVMGGYGHSRLSEWVFGGATRDMMADLKTPVLMAH
jgi:nucleotide-binding universal stress UspA family protein